MVPDEERYTFPPPAMTPVHAQAPTGPVGLVEPLTAREREVLVQLGQRWSNKEIAAALQVSPETVKRHAATIYAKLGAAGRRAAAQRAAELGLLPAL
jgi:ATP/maltotriose-dependent transcriptional regulator MalT